MTAKIEPRSGLYYGWDLGEDGWNTGMDANLERLGRYGFHASVKSIASSPAVSPNAGDGYIIGSSATGEWAGHEDDVTVWTGEEWDFATPSIGWRVNVEDAGNIQYVYTGIWDVSSAGTVSWSSVLSKPDSISAISSLTMGADEAFYYSSASVAVKYTITSFARTLLSDADAASMRATLGVSGGGQVDEVVAGTGIDVDVTDPTKPIVKNDGVMSVVAGSGISVDDTDPQNPIVKATGGGGGAAWGGITGTITDQTDLISLVKTLTLVKPSADSPCIKKTGAGTVSIAAGTSVGVNGEYKEFAVDTAVSMPVLAAGEDYSVWVKPDGTAVAVADPYSSPAAAPVVGAVKIGGFHHGLVPHAETVAGGGFSTSGVTSAGGSMGWTQGDVDKIAGINEFSIWDLAWRCKGEQRGMTYDPVTGIWVAIYFMSTDPDANGPSRYNTNVASGTVLPKVPLAWGGNGTLAYAELRSWEANELATAFGHRLIRYEEFCSIAFGAHEQQSLGGASSTIPATAREPNYTSRIGVEQATGHAWVIGGPIHSVSGSAYAGNGRGSFYAGDYGLVLLGGARSSAANSGSRAANFNFALSASRWNDCVRCAGDHLNLGRAAR